MLKLTPNEANSLDMENHSWGQNLQEAVPFPPHVGPDQSFPSGQCPSCAPDAVCVPRAVHLGAPRCHSAGAVIQVACTLTLPTYAPRGFLCLRTPLCALTLRLLRVPQLGSDNTLSSHSKLGPVAPS
ncbi:hypothetical protein POUND7_020601 [Theobroma cacao]